jgi:hypothetical protein
MQRALIPSLKWQVHRWSEHLGLIGGLAIIIILMVIVLLLTWTRPLQAKLNQLQGRVHTSLKQEKKITADDQLNLFLTKLPSITKRAESVEALLDIAAQQQLTVDEVRYKSVNHINDQISHFHVEFNLIAEYPAIQHFLSALQYQLSFVSIESIRFKRDSIKDPLIETNIHLILHFKQS